MITILGFASLLVAVAALIAACRMKGYAKGKADGYQTGYQEGFAAAREIVGFVQAQIESLDWWSVAEREVKQVRERIRDEERWP